MIPHPIDVDVGEARLAHCIGHHFPAETLARRFPEGIPEIGEHAVDVDPKPQRHRRIKILCSGLSLIGNDGGQYGGQYGYQDRGYAAGDLMFRCNVDYRGAVTNVRIARNDSYRRY